MENLRILVIPGYRIFPIDSGGAHGQLTFLEKQQYQYSIDLVATPGNIALEYIEEFKKRFPGLNLLMVGYNKPSASKKIKTFLRKQYRKLSGKDIAYSLNKSRINGFIINDPEHVEAIRELSLQKKYDVIQVEHVKNMGLIEVLAGESKKIFVHHELCHTRLYQDMRSLSYSDVYSRYIASVAEGAEIAWLNKYDGIITFSEDDTALLREKGVMTKQQVARPFALFEDELQYSYDPLQLKNLAFVGGETHYPNKEGLMWFLQNIFPLVQKQLPQIVLQVTGRWSEKFRSTITDQHIQFTGFIDDIDRVLKNAILVVPIRIGSGVRVKVFTSLAKGIPVVSTILGASSIPGLVQNKNIMLADDANLFADSVIQLSRNDSLRKEISENAYRLATENFRNIGFVEERNTFYETILADE